MTNECKHRDREAFLISVMREAIHTHHDVLVNAAAHVRLNAQHYGSFLVGGSAYVVSPYDHRLCAGVNFKPYPHARPRCCAEESIIKQVRNFSGVILAMVVCAPPKKDDWSGLDSGFLISCVFCRRMFRKELKRHNPVIRPYTALTFVNADNGQEETMAVRDLLAITEERDKLWGTSA